MPLRPPHPITFIRRQATSSGQGNTLMLGCLELAPRVTLYSRRAGRLLERVGLERPSLKLSGLLAELSAEGHKGIPAILVDKLSIALGEMLAGRSPPPLPALPPPLKRLHDAVLVLEEKTRREDPSAGPRARVARVSLDENPSAFFYAEGRGLDAVPSGLAVMLTDAAREPLRFLSVRGPMLDVDARLYALERIKDVILEPIGDEGPRLLSMLVSGNVVRLAVLDGGGLRITLRDAALAPALGLDDEDREAPGRYAVFSAARARAVVAALALRDDVTLAWTSAQHLSASRAELKQLRVRLGEKRDWLGVEGSAVLDDGTSVELNDLIDALRLGRRYVVAGEGRAAVVVAITDALASALEPLAAAAPTLPALASLLDAGVSFAESGALAELKATLERARALDGEPPAALHASLRPYQKEGLRFLRRVVAWGTGGILADDMGLGKTVQAIALLVERAKDGPALVVAPTSVCFNWAHELARFAPGLSVLRHEGARRKSVLAEAGPGSVVIASYAIVQRDAALLAPTRFSTLILDEAQQVKNAGTRRAKAVRALSADARLALSGTPLENHTGELWAIFDAIAPGLFGSWTEFKARFASPIEKDADVRRRKTLSRAIAPFVLRRKKQDVAPELPARTDVTKLLELDVAERRTYDRLRQAILLELARDDEREAAPDGNQRRIQVLAAITRLRLAACHPAFAGDALLPPDQTPPGTKQRALVELLLELKDTGHKALVFSQFVRHLELARAAATAAGITSLQLDGSTPGKDREALVAEFQSGAVDAFFLSLKAGGTGLNLVRASYVVHLDPWWNPAVEDQAADRAHRIGQTEPVTVVRLIAQDTLEEQMLELHAHKRALVEGVLDGTAAAASLSVDELIALVKSTRRTAREGDQTQELAVVDED